jgi:hypothetical protein
VGSGAGLGRGRNSEKDLRPADGGDDTFRKSYKESEITDLGGEKDRLES